MLITGREIQLTPISISRKSLMILEIQNTQIEQEICYQTMAAMTATMVMTETMVVIAETAEVQNKI